ncbi:transposase [Roseovarius sp. M141]|uniref:IS66-like element accessory protein TnpA n=1 Tax=Roseovarius sp. M141 TaxID=2583806 RepID=UPI0020CC7F8A|nr:transposase [Roseovarius sp. M141]MCQ0090918.1 transposase [Roseovarius sp. M141]MCQ0090955.1 transposase [Roseovarius sp. M141]
MSDFIYRPQIEVLSAADGIRRRQWSDEGKLRIVEESFVGHRQVTATARRHGICRSLLTIWRRQYRNGELGAGRPVSFAPVTVTKGVPASQTGPVDPPDLPRNSQVEIALPNGRRLVVPTGVEPEALARILSVVDGQ